MQKQESIQKIPQNQDQMIGLGMLGVFAGILMFWECFNAQGRALLEVWLGLNSSILCASAANIKY